MCKKNESINKAKQNEKHKLCAPSGVVRESSILKHDEGITPGITEYS